MNSNPFIVAAPDDYKDDFQRELEMVEKLEEADIAIATLQKQLTGEKTSKKEMLSNAQKIHEEFRPDDVAGGWGQIHNYQSLLSIMRKYAFNYKTFQKRIREKIEIIRSYREEKERKESYISSLLQSLHEQSTEITSLRTNQSQHQYSLEPPIKTDKKGQQCLICYDNLKTVVMIPCGHKVVCSICELQLLNQWSQDSKTKTCMVCRIPVEDHGILEEKPIDNKKYCKRIVVDNQIGYVPVDTSTPEEKFKIYDSHIVATSQT